MNAKWTIMMSLLLILVSACAGEPPAGYGPDRRTTPTPQEGAQNDLTWVPSAEEIVISATSCCGFVPAIYIQNALPDAMLWGDGRIVWVTLDDTGQRQVFEGRLATGEMVALLQKIIDAGFFTWQDRYSNDLVADAADTCLSVNLEDRAKQVCEYFEGAPQAFHALIAELSQGAGAQGAPFIPQQAFVTSYPIGTIADPVEQVDLVWPDDGSADSLKSLESGVWAEGNTLELAWQVVNVRPWGMIVQEGDTYYQLSVQVPGLSQQSPPAP